MKLGIRILAVCSAICFVITSAAQKKTDISISALKYLSQYEIPYLTSFKNTSVGGLSGIDYNRKADEYYMICDDRSNINPARFYTAKIVLKGNVIDTVVFTEVTRLLQPNGNEYPSTKTDPTRSPDPEALRYNPVFKNFVWSNEGEKIIKKDSVILQNPSIRLMNKKGLNITDFPLPSQFYMNAGDKGPRLNGVFEGLCFADNNRVLYVTTEMPLYDDGPAAGLKDTTAFVRVLKYNLKNKKAVAQYAYKLEPVAHAPEPATAFNVNGVVDILDVGKDNFLITERSFSTGVKSCTVKTFLCNFKNASNIASLSSIQKNTAIKAVSKKLVLNMDELGQYIDNIEGATFGPILPNGHHSLIFVSDNNFSPLQKTQFFLFEVIP